MPLISGRFFRFSRRRCWQGLAALSLLGGSVAGLPAAQADLTVDGNDNAVVDSANGGYQQSGASRFNTMTVSGGTLQVDGTMGVVQWTRIGPLSRMLVAGTYDGDPGATGSTNGVLSVNSGVLDVIGTVQNLGVLASNDCTQITFSDGSVVSMDRLLVNGDGVITADSSGSVSVQDAELNGGQLVVSQSVNLGTMSLQDAQVTVDSGATVTSTGPITLNHDGVLNLNGTVSGSGSLVVGDGGRLSGNGGTSQLNVQVDQGGTLCPGCSEVGVLNISGQLSQAGGSSTVIDLQQSSGDQIRVTGIANVAGDITVQMDEQIAGPIADGSSWTVLTATGGVNGSYESAKVDSAVLSFRVSYTADTVQLTASRAGYESLGATANQSAVGRGLDQSLSLAAGQSDMAGLIATLDGLSLLQLQQSLDALSPLIYADNSELSDRTVRGYQQVIGDHLRSVRMPMPDVLWQPYLQESAPSSIDGVLGESASSSDPTLPVSADPRVPPSLRRDPQAPRGNVFFTPWAQSGSADDRRQRIGYDCQSVGVVLGGDIVVLDDLVLGLAGQYAYSHAVMDQQAGSSQLHTGRFGPYLSFFTDGFFLDASFSAGIHSYQTHRQVRIPNLTKTADATYQGLDLSTAIGGGYQFQSGNWLLTPELSFEHSYLHQQGAEESGADAANLQMLYRTNNTLYSRVGFRVQYHWDPLIGQLAVVPELSVGWRYSWLAPSDIQARFAQGAAETFSVQVADGGRNSGTLGLGVNIQWSPHMAGTVRYQFQLDDYGMGHSLQAGFEYRF